MHFWRGFAVALANPKTIAFFTAFLPQFIDPSLPAERQLAVMCAVSVVLAAFTDSSWAIAAGLGRAWFMTTWRTKLLGRMSGVALIGGGIGSPWRAGRVRDALKGGTIQTPSWDRKNRSVTTLYAVCPAVPPP